MADDFLFKPFEEMTPEDYAAVGFKSGLEIHQQLLTATKLFCRCPAGRYSTNTTPRSSATCGRRSPSSASTTARP